MGGQGYLKVLWPRFRAKVKVQPTDIEGTWWRLKGGLNLGWWAQLSVLRMNWVEVDGGSGIQEGTWVEVQRGGSTSVSGGTGYLARLQR